MSRAEKVAEAQRLRAQGLMTREIAERMGVAKSTADGYLNDPDLSKQRARHARYSQPCVDCGKPTDGSGGFASPRRRCEPCKERHAHETRYWTPDAIIGALQGWTDEHGGIPPSASQWLRNGAPVGYPAVVMVQREFGSWNAGLRAAGLVPRPTGCYGRDGEDLELCREIRERYEAGELSMELAEEYGCDRQTILYRIRKAGGKARTPGTYDRSRAA